jgi:hypothetical protein
MLGVALFASSVLFSTILHHTPHETQEREMSSSSSLSLSLSSLPAVRVPAVGEETETVTVAETEIETESCRNSTGDQDRDTSPVSSGGRGPGTATATATTATANINNKNNNNKSRNKKRKIPLTTSETRQEGELEAAEAALASALSAIKSLSNNNISTISPEFITAQQELKAAKSQLHKLKKRKLTTVDNPAAWSCYPPPCEVPRESSDNRFTQSFDVTCLMLKPEYSSEDEKKIAEEMISTCRKDAQDFFDLYGFVVFSNVLSPHECDTTVSEIWVNLRVVDCKGVRLFIPYTFYLCRII